MLLPQLHALNHGKALLFESWLIKATVNERIIIL